MAHGEFGTAINCMDGRVQLPVIDWMQKEFHLDYIDMITEAGADKVLAAGTREQIESVKSRAAISVNVHKSKVIAVVGHHDCAGNPVTPEQHHSNLLDAVSAVNSWRLPVDKVLALWVDHDWRVRTIVAQR
jgi:carbonic anhydrase